MSYQNQGGWHDNSGGQQESDYGQVLWQSSQDSQGYHDQWTSYGDAGHIKKYSHEQKSVDPYSNHQYPPYTNRRTSQKSVSALSKKNNPSVKLVPVPGPVQDERYAGVNQSRFEKKRTPSAYREYRYDHQGNLWMKNGPVRTAGRFCFCTILTTVFLIVTIALSLVLWIRPPNVQLGSVQTQGGLQKLSGGGFQVNLSTVITVDNFNYFNVDMRKIKVDVFYPIDNTPVGGGTANDVLFKSNSETNFTFPFALKYNPLNDATGQVLADIATKCGVGGGQRRDITVNYQLTLGIQILLFTVSPVISNAFSFACPISSSSIFGSSL